MTAFLIIYGILNVLVFALYMSDFCTINAPSFERMYAKLKMNNPILCAILKGLFCIVFLPATILYVIFLMCIAIVMVIIITSINT